MVLCEVAHGKLAEREEMIRQQQEGNVCLYCLDNELQGLSVVTPEPGGTSAMLDQG